MSARWLGRTRELAFTQDASGPLAWSDERHYAFLMANKDAAGSRRLKTPFKHLLPPLSREEFFALRTSIDDHGVLDAVVTDEHDAVLDGHHRLRIDPRAPRRVVTGLSEGEKMAFTIRANFARRNLSPAQKKGLLKSMKEVAAKLRAENPKRNTQKRIAELLGVSRQSVAEWFRQGRTTLHDSRNSIVQAESAFLADARFTIPARVRPEIVRRRLAGHSQVRIAADFKVDPSTVSRIIRRHEREQEAARAAADAAAQAAKLGELGIVVGDYRKIGGRIANASVDLIFTDPPFQREHIKQYADLGQLAAHVLKPGGSLITYLGDYALPEVLSRVLESPELRFWWPLAVMHTGRTTVLDKFGVAVRHKTLLWFVKGGQRAPKHQVDTLVVSQREKRHHAWEQGLTEARYYISKLAPPGGLVLDPYAGGGTTCIAALETGRRYIAFERNRATARRARARIAACPAVVP